MARLLLEWLNSEVVLSREVVSLDEDFKDGYLLAELLLKYNQIGNFEQFSPKGTPSAKINNFTLLEPVMRQVGVTFNSKIAFDIVNCKAGVMKTLLYELKIVLDRISKRAANSSQDPEKAKILRLIQPSRPVYDLTMSATFENSMRTIMENPNDVMMEKTLRRFKERSVEMKQTVTLGYSMSMDAVTTDIQRKKEIHRHRKQHEVEFAEAWETINIDQWKSNQRVAKERRELVQRLNNSETLRRTTRKAKAHEDAREDTLSGIEAFTRNLETNIVAEDPESSKAIGKKLIKTVVGDASEGLPTLTYIDKSYLDEGLVAAQKAMKEHHQDGLARQQTHDQRRRKFVRERESTQSLLLHQYSESEIVDRLLIWCHAEEAERAAESLVRQHLQVITRNRANREELIRQMNEEAAVRHQQWLSELARREVEWVFHPAVAAQQQRSDIRAEAAASASRQQSIEIALEVIDKLIDVTDWVVACRRFGVYDASVASAVAVDGSPTAAAAGAAVSLLLPLELWQDVATMFSLEVPVSAALPPPEPSNVWHTLPHSLSEQPLVVDAPWLFGQPFQASSVLNKDDLYTQSRNRNVFAVDAVDSSEEKSPSFGDEDAELAALPPLPIPASSGSVADDAPHSEMSDALAKKDSDDHIAVVAGVEVAGDYDQAVEASVHASESASAFITPSWVQNVPAKYMMGETIVQIRCVSEPIPEDPSPPIKLPHFLCRVVVCGPSDTARKSVCEVFRAAVMGVEVVNLESLVGTAMILGQQIEQLDRLAKEGYKEKTAKQLLASRVYRSLSCGEALPDDLCVALIIQALHELPNASPGFVLEDFPSTDIQATLLLEALSGIRYDQRRPQPLDKVTPFALPRPQDVLKYDVAKCGLDLALFVDTGDSLKLTSERVSSRRTNDGSIVHISEDTVSVEGLQELYTPSRPVETTSICHAIAATKCSKLQDFFSSLGIARTESFSDKAALEAFAGELAAEFAKKVTAAMATDDFEIMDDDGQEMDGEDLLAGEGEGEGATNEVALEGSTDSIEGQGQGLERSDSLEEMDLDEEEQAEAEEKLRKEEERLKLVARVQNITFPVHTPLPKQLADALASLWQRCEAQSELATFAFFNALRSIRYQKVQRRRAVNDLISTVLISKDHRQNLLEDFRVGFNEIDTDFRFDEDCKAELHLRALELGDVIWTLCDERKTKAEEILTSVQQDAAVPLSVHSVKCEASALLQAELARFVASVDVLLDTSKALVGFDYSAAIANPLEETLAVPESVFMESGADSPVNKSPTADGKHKAAAKDAKAAPAKGKGKDVPAAPVPYRVPVSEVLLVPEQMKQLPEAKPAEEVVEDKGKKAKAAPPKGKKGEKVEEGPADPHDAMEKSFLLALQPWSRDAFTVNRTLYMDNEAVCSYIERAIWHEVERLRASAAAIRAIVEHNCKWLEDSEVNLLALLSGKISARHQREVLAAQCVLRLIGETIENCEPIREEWLLAPDAVAVMKQQLVVPAPPPPVVPVINRSFPDLSIPRS